jgi:hypothetical protein
MNIFLKSLLAAIIVTGFGAIIFFKQKTKSYNASLDLKLAKSDADHSVFKASDIPLLQAIINSRASSICKDWKVELNRSGKFEIALKGITDTTGLSEIFTTTGNFGIWEMYTLNQIYSAFETADNIILASGIDTISIPNTDTGTNTLLSNVAKEYVRRKSLFKIFKRGNFSSENDPELGMLRHSDKSDLIKLLQIPGVTHVLPKDIRFIFGRSTMPIKKNDSLISLYAIKTYNRPDKPFLSNKDIKDAFQNFHPATSKPIIQFEFKQSAARTWEKLTERNVNKPLAIVLDDKLISAPRVVEKITGGRSQIAGDFSLTEAKRIASQLNSDPLPVPLAINSLKLSVNNLFDKKTVLFLSACLAVIFGMTFLIFYLLKPPANNSFPGAFQTQNLP